MLTIHAYAIEWTQLLFAVVGTFINLAGAHSAMKDLLFLTTMGWNGPRKVIARSNIQWEVIRLTVQVLFVVVGVTSVLTPPPPPIAGDYELGATVIRICLMTASFLLAFKSFWGQWERKLLLEMWKGEERRKGEDRRHGDHRDSDHHD